ncbi:putative glycolipid-binding domain-containing protein [Actinomycetes bacterium KLBMP 9759]
MVTWQSEDGHGLEGTRLSFGGDGGLRAFGRQIRVEPDGDFSASYRLVVTEGGQFERLSLTSANAERERHLTINRTEDNFWLLDTGAGGERTDLGGARDVDVAGCVLFNSLPIRRLNLHRETGEHTLPMVYVSLPQLEVTLVEQHYRTISTLDADGFAVIGFSTEGFNADLVVDADGVVVRYPGIANRLEGRDAVAVS